MLVGDVILVLSEAGEVILVEASPKKYRELASMPAIEGVTWNNPALAGPLLLVRNAEEAACFELPLRDAAASASSRRRDAAGQFATIGGTGELCVAADDSATLLRSAGAEFAGSPRRG